MANNRLRISTEIDFEQEGFYTGTLPVPLCADRSANQAQSGQAAASAGGCDSLKRQNLRIPP